MISTVSQHIHQAKLLLQSIKPPSARTAYELSTTAADHHTPAKLGVRNYSNRNAGRSNPILSYPLYNKPTQIDARNALLRHSAVSPNPAKANTGKGFHGKPGLLAERARP